MIFPVSTFSSTVNWRRRRAVVINQEIVEVEVFPFDQNPELPGDFDLNNQVGIDLTA